MSGNNTISQRSVHYGFEARTGNQYAISAGEWSAVVAELGASLRELKWRGEDIIVPFDPDKVIPCCNGWVLAPYPNRVTNGQYSFDGEDYQMPIDEFDRQSSLHGYATVICGSLRTCRNRM